MIPLVTFSNLNVTYEHEGAEVAVFLNQSMYVFSPFHVTITDSCTRHVC
jgi:hypothetical protein